MDNRRRAMDKHIDSGADNMLIHSSSKKKLSVAHKLHSHYCGESNPEIIMMINNGEV